MDANRYATKKTIAQGMLDIALLTANASQLKYVLQVGDKHEFYTLMLTLITVSIILQVSVCQKSTKICSNVFQFKITSGALNLSLSLLRDCRLHLEEYQKSANYINNSVATMAFLVTLTNLLLSAFDPTILRYMDL